MWLELFILLLIDMREKLEHIITNCERVYQNILSGKYGTKARVELLNEIENILTIAKK
jgi:hypothetical protein